MSPRAQAAAQAILAFFAALFDLLLGLALIANTVFGVFALGLLVTTGQLPPQFETKALQAYVFLAATLGLLSLWSQGSREKREREAAGRRMLGWRN